MKSSHIALGVIVAAIWGFNYVPIKVALESFPPLLLVTLRFCAVAVLALFLPKPKLSWKQMATIAAVLFFGQFTLLFIGMKLGMLPGLASVVMQAQTFITLAMAAFFLKEETTKRQMGGGLLALIGLGLISLTLGHDVSMLGFLLTLAATTSASYGNILLRRAPNPGNMLALMAWMSLLVPIPTFLSSLIFEGWPAISYALTHASAKSVASVIYIAVFSTLIGYGLWGYLLQRNAAGRVGFFLLLVPGFGILSAFLVFGETFPPLRLAGTGLLIAGLGLSLAPKLARRKQTPDLPD